MRYGEVEYQVKEFSGVVQMKMNKSSENSLVFKEQRSMKKVKKIKMFNRTTRNSRVNTEKDSSPEFRKIREEILKSKHFKEKQFKNKSKLKEFMDTFEIKRRKSNPSKKLPSRTHV
jgi:hypothetical protein